MPSHEGNRATRNLTTLIEKSSKNSSRESSVSGRVLWTVISLCGMWCWLWSTGCDGWRRRDRVSVADFVTVNVELELINACERYSESERTAGRLRIFAAHGQSSVAITAFVQQHQTDPDDWLAVEEAIVKRLEAQRRNMDEIARTIGWRGFVIVPRMDIRVESDSTAATVDSLMLGEHVTVAGRRDAWVQVRSAAGRTGWVPMEVLMPDATPTLPQ